MLLVLCRRALSAPAIPRRFWIVSNAFLVNKGIATTPGVYHRDHEDADDHDHEADDHDYAVLRCLLSSGVWLSGAMQTRGTNKTLDPTPT